MKTSNRKTTGIWIVLLVALCIALAAGGYFLLSRYLQTEKQPVAVVGAVPPASAQEEDLFNLRMFYPVGNRLEMVEKVLPRRTKESAITEAVIEEYFKGPGEGEVSCIPENVKLLGLYNGGDHVLYVDLSDELRRNFQGDALQEYLLLQGLYESLISNLEGISDIKVLVDGKEIETLGGHIYLKYTLKDAVSYDYKGDEEISLE
ncbi:MAG: GerMN domain-containing protein [Candidatus Sulfobium sp.]|jgi:spore germination protein GerM